MRTWSLAAVAAAILAGGAGSLAADAIATRPAPAAAAGSITLPGAKAGGPPAEAGPTSRAGAAGAAGTAAGAGSAGSAGSAGGPPRGAGEVGWAGSVPVQRGPAGVPGTGGAAGRTVVRGPVRHAPAAAYHLAPAAGRRPHELRIEFPRGSAGQWTYQPYGPALLTEPGAEDGDGVVIDPGDYPAGAVFFVRMTLGYLSDSAGCSRLYNASTQRTVEFSQVCGSAGPGPQSPDRQYRIDDTRPVRLARGEHVYDLQGVRTAGLGGPVLVAGELIIRWLE
ncbi:MAG: hypothetical protein V7637_5402 [Mycobacteriales bacterium]